MIKCKEDLKRLWKECKPHITLKGKSDDSILVSVYQFFATRYDDFTKDDAKQVMLALVYDYGFLYR